MIVDDELRYEISSSRRVIQRWVATALQAISVVILVAAVAVLWRVVAYESQDQLVWVSFLNGDVFEVPVYESVDQAVAAMRAKQVAPVQAQR